MVTARGAANWCLMGMRFQFCKRKGFPEEGVGDGFVTLKYLAYELVQPSSGGQMGWGSAAEPVFCLVRPQSLRHTEKKREDKQDVELKKLRLSSGLVATQLHWLQHFSGMHVLTPVCWCSVGTVPRSRVKPSTLCPQTAPLPAPSGLLQSTECPQGGDWYRSSFVGLTCSASSPGQAPWVFLTSVSSARSQRAALLSNLTSSKFRMKKPGNWK